MDVSRVPPSSRLSRPPEPTDLTLFGATHPVVRTPPSLVKNRHRLLEWVTSSRRRPPTRQRHRCPLRLATASTSQPSSTSPRPTRATTPKGDADVRHPADFLAAASSLHGGRLEVAAQDCHREFNTRSPPRPSSVDKARQSLLAGCSPLPEQAKPERRTSSTFRDVLERFAFDNICSLVVWNGLPISRRRQREGARFVLPRVRPARAPQIERMNWWPLP
ncbi:hypothetical protein C4D60_Mb00t19980 [Musa balbisiana]|uniref:Uncharacterized protein n=1 Tax=Musa balbisiana TaxID=52838 RepID=A0A4S8I3U8_MUSBA|nr:hypothetical protein C4D60_Mb00t19980 [Musa balbisiana]